MHNIPQISERLLQFIWLFRYFNAANISTIDGKQIQVIHPGSLNHNQGPDFLEAKIKIENTLWIGNVELHIKSSDWLVHNHANDTNYENIILHAVWENDKTINGKNGETIPTIELQRYIPKLMLWRYSELMQSQNFVACQQHLPALSSVSWLAWKERLLVERLQRKSIAIKQNIDAVNQHWEEVFWWQLASNFGIKVNAEAFLQIAKSIPISILAKHKSQIHQLEALLFGQANLLNENFKEDYPQLLQREYRFLKNKYQLQKLLIAPAFLRMRPAAFPTIRLAQLAMLVKQSSHLFSLVKETKSITEIKKLFDVSANDYWNYHYLFDEPINFKQKNIGNQMIENIIINTVVPVLFAYGSVRNENSYKEKAINWLQQLLPERNAITKKWEMFGVENISAFDSQALIELKNNYCRYKKCLDCTVGNKVLRM